MSNVIEIEHLYKEYRLGLIGYGTLREDLQSWWATARGKEDPNSMLYSGDQSGDGNTLDHILALSDLNLTVTRGERVGIIGPNGAGKTTLLKILSRIAAPTKGTARIKGRVASLIAVGTGMHGELTGRENIYLNGSIMGLRKFEIDQRFDEIVDFSGVEQFIDTPVKRYSSGMYVRLGFAVAAHLDPNVLIVDEVLAVGDAEFRKKALGKMKNVSEGEDRTILFVSHNMGAIENLCQRTILLEKGRIIEDGNSSSVITRYLFGEEGQSAEKVWEATSTTNAPDIHVPPGQEIGCFKAIRTIDNSEKLCKSFSVRDNIYLQMEYEIFKDIREYIEITYWLNNERGELVFLTFDPSLYENGCFRSKGSYKSTCKIPGDLLNCGTYKVSALIQKKEGVYLREIDVMSFNVRDDWDKNGARGLCRPNKQWPPAVIRPKLEWKTVPI